ncbi:MAG: hypothetical protein CSA22_02555 [Deltaproteobacteria bacterium]|nr:MAG: hypothetical protein CSA22_02555 [Deltaproteobacteria bacterium]
MTAKKTMVLLLGMLVLNACVQNRPRPAATQPPAKTGGETVAINLDHASLRTEIIGANGYALALFYNNQYRPSAELEAIFDALSVKYKDAAVYGKFFWYLDWNGEQYGLDMLPTVILFNNGEEIDRIRGMDTDKNRIQKDMDLWLRKNVVNPQGDGFSGAFTYRFNNTYTLSISN